MTMHRRSFLSAAALAGLFAALPRAIAGAFGYPRALQGPMVGAPGPEHFTVWVRASGAFEVALEYATDRDFRAVVQGPRAMAGAAEDGCVVLRAEGLRPDTPYWYRLKYDGVADRFQPLPHRTRTAPAGAADFRVAFGSCCRIQYDADQRIWNTVRALEPDMFLWLGDNIYADSDQPAAIADLYARGRTVERLEPLLRSIPQLATWDDHDFGYNDSDGLSPYKAESLRIFRRFWANPAYGEPDNPGVYFRQHYGGVDFFVLDGRYHRDPTDRPDNAGKTMLGARQKAWLKRELKASRTPFKVLAIGGGWSSAENEKGGDSWAVFMTERNELFDFIRDEGIGGVVCVSGDSHMGELNCIPWSERGGYDIYDFCSSPLAQLPAAKHTRQAPEVRVRDVWTRSVNVGLLRFDMTADTPTLTYTLHDELGEAVWDPLVLTPADLANGVRSWDRKADPEELRRLQRFRQGKGYYGFDPVEGWPDRPYYGEE
ncbi:alkaline phosphatase D family protein [Luteimonas sp. SJ-92]|uniref:Alkaline phosphatase D family protein n=1 Tax=Luteimonas salinisoli TaxID=2752307 RepID=A0A853JCB2_9GAMM|nr:alkaline phosphatase D family protein [Luteimonas salinisoli]NZA26893.1 alkaline phosphatase D family protein [Luteimonas salinisoli]